MARSTTTITRPTPSVPPQIGRPTDYTPAAAAAICELLADGFSLRSICAADGAPDKSTVFRWLAARSDFRDQYRLAREIQADTLAEECLEIVDETVASRLELERARLRVKARQWYASKLHPRVYGTVADGGSRESSERHAAGRRGVYADLAALSLKDFLPPPPTGE